MYIDPTAGSMIFQVLAAGAIAAASMVRGVRTAVKEFFRNILGRRRV
jgi:hypothetical protein